MPLVRKSAGPITAKTADPATISNLLASGSEEERWSAARSAVDLPGGAKLLGEALPGERNPRVREAMFTGLARIGTSESVEFLLPVLHSDDANLRTGALDALRSMRGMVSAYIPRLFGDGDSDVRLLACELVRNLPGDEAERLLCGLLDVESQPNVCASAVEVLAEIGSAQALPALARCEERFRDTPFLAFSIKIATDRIRSQSRRV